MKNLLKTDNKILFGLRILLPILCLVVMGFIFSNSLQSGASSSAQSSAVTDAVQDVAGVIAPDSEIANATGEAYDKLHADIRTLAHFAEFALLGALLCWTYRAYTDKKKFLYAPASIIVLVPIIDEFLQTFSQARGAEWKDVLMDTCGGVSGFVLAALTLVLGVHIYRKRLQKKALIAAAAVAKSDVASEEKQV